MSRPMTSRPARSAAMPMMPVVLRGRCATGDRCPEVHGTALMDLGAAHTFIVPKAVQKLGLEHVGQGEIRGIAGDRDKPLVLDRYGVQMSFPGTRLRDVPLFKWGAYAKSQPTPRGRVGLIGRDAMAGGDKPSAGMRVEYDAPSGSLTVRPSRAKTGKRKGRAGEDEAANKPASSRAAIALAKRAVKYLYEDDPDFVTGGCGDVSILLAKLLQQRGYAAVVRYGYGEQHGERYFHAWLDVDGAPFDAVLWVQRARAKLHPVAREEEPGIAAIIGCDLDEDDWRLNDVLEHLGLGQGPVGKQRGFSEVEVLGLLTVGTLGFAAAPLINRRIEARPLGLRVPPSVAASVVSLVGAGVAHHAGWNKTARAAAALGVGLGAGTLATARRDGGMLASTRGER